MEIETYKLTLHTCECGYKTLSSVQACKHSKTNKCLQYTMVKKEMRFVSEEDHLASHKKTTINQGDNVQRDKIVNNITDSVVDQSTNITLVLPDRTTKEDFLEYLETLGHLGFRAQQQVLTMPGKMLMFTRDPKKLPGALIERNKKIVEKLPDGSDRVMSKKKAVQTYTHEAADALCLRPPADGVLDCLETERGFKRTKMSLHDATKLRVDNPIIYHNGVPANVKAQQTIMEQHVEKSLDKITAENKTNGFL